MATGEIFVVRLVLKKEGDVFGRKRLGIIRAGARKDLHGVASGLFGEDERLV